MMQFLEYFFDIYIVWQKLVKTDNYLLVNGIFVDF